MYLYLSFTAILRDITCIYMYHLYPIQYCALLVIYLSCLSCILATTPIVAVQSATPPTQSPKSSLASDSGATPTQEFFSKATSAATKGTFTPTKHTPSGSLTTPPLPSRASFASTAKETLLLSQLDLASLMKLMPSVLEPGRPMTTVSDDLRAA